MTSGDYGIENGRWLCSWMIRFSALQKSSSVFQRSVETLTPVRMPRNWLPCSLLLLAAQLPG